MPILNQYNLAPCRSVTTTQTVAGTTTTAGLHLNLHWRIDFGATGAVQTTSRIARGMTVTRSGAGVYAITGLPAGDFVSHYLQANQALAPVKSWQVTAFSATAGTATFTHSVAGTATDPTSGDSVSVFTRVEGR